MILATRYNNPLAAPGTNDADALLAAYRTYAGNQQLTLNDLYALMTKPSAARDSFTASLTAEVTLVRSRYYTQQYAG